MCQKLWSDDVSSLRYGARRMQFFILGHFLRFYSPNSPKNQNFEKMKKTPGDIITLHMCTKKYDQMMYGSWDMLRDGRTDVQMDVRMDERTDRWTDGRKKWHIEVGALPKNWNRVPAKIIGKSKISEMHFPILLLLKIKADL